MSPRRSLRKLAQQCAIVHYDSNECINIVQYIITCTIHAMSETNDGYKSQHGENKNLRDIEYTAVHIRQKSSLQLSASCLVYSTTPPHCCTSYSCALSIFFCSIIKGPWKVFSSNYQPICSPLYERFHHMLKRWVLLIAQSHKNVVITGKYLDPAETI